ncbi:plasmid recombination protein [Treponema sp. OttesenSCG-928-L16]|nr:plasmid recombination protein [Treponema sp. OttesenSCG-928-L16]
MAENKQVLHLRRIKSMAGGIQVMKHNAREKDNLVSDGYIDIEKSKFNVYEGAHIADEFLKVYKKMINDAQLKRKPQKNASPIVEFIVSTSHDFSRDWEKNEEKKKLIDQYFSDAKIFIRKKYGDFIVSSAIHFDETTPHMHILCVPLVKKKGLKK